MAISVRNCGEYSRNIHHDVIFIRVYNFRRKCFALTPTGKMIRSVFELYFLLVKTARNKMCGELGASESTAYQTIRNGETESEKSITKLVMHLVIVKVVLCQKP